MKFLGMVVCLCTILLIGSAEAQVVSISSGSWSSDTTWAGGVVPTLADDVQISSGHTIDVSDTLAYAHSVSFADTSCHIDMDSTSRLMLTGNFTLADTNHNVFAPGWSPENAYLWFVGGETQTLAGWNPARGSTSFRNVVVAKDSATVLTTGGTGMRLGLQNTFDVISGTFVLGFGDDLECRWTQSAVYTSDQQLHITVHPGAEFLLDGGADYHHMWAGSGGIRIGGFTVYGRLDLAQASSLDLNIDSMYVGAGGVVELGIGLWSSASGAKFNPRVIVVDSAGVLYCQTYSPIWLDPAATVTVLPNGQFKTSSRETVFPPVFDNQGSVRYQRNTLSDPVDQTVFDSDYNSLELSFSIDGAARKTWDLTGNRIVADSLSINNSALAEITAASPQSVTVENVLRLTSGQLNVSDPELDLVLADNATISRATGSLLGTPSFAGKVTVRYTSSVSSVTTGPELPAGANELDTLVIFTPDQSVTLGSDARINGALTLSSGIFDNDGPDGDFSLVFADGAAIRRATGVMTTAPVCEGVLDLEYISTIDSVVTGVEIPASALRNLSILGNKGVRLGGNVTVGGTLLVADSGLSTGSYAVTLGGAGLLDETAGFPVEGVVQTTRPISSGVLQEFGNLGLAVTPSAGSSGNVTVVRTSGSVVGGSGVSSIARSFVVSGGSPSGWTGSVVLAYSERELNGLAEADLQAFWSSDGTSWSARGGTVDVSANTVTISTPVAVGGHWTLGTASGCCVRRGDVNNDAKVIVSDLTYLVSFLFKAGPAPVCAAHGDVNNDGKTIVSDLTYLVNFLFKAGSAPAGC